ncbi:arylamine N-acetyltransferase, pineal gland isozyme NAT-3-like [Brachyhypopomus gauderio]|uniref:arylamine N-acetyltransferase, pineal gland isozyme NAT-3-like n=1 Tax=Brachyhypopomus gauderio TaxID=698409 RepID=UPI00404358F5
MSVKMDVQKYLTRIDCPGPCAPTIDTLRTLHLNHLLTVPFEDLTIHMGQRVRLELPLLYEKIVLNRRGGFCYENNGLFSWLLSQLGFEVDILAAQVKNRFTGAYGPPFDHLIIMVTLDGHKWLCDVGFGSGFQLPLSLKSDRAQRQSHGVYRVRTQGKLMYTEMLTESDKIKDPKDNTAWRELYKFSLEPCQRDDFKAMCDYHQSSVNSIFFCKSFCSLLLPNGRITLIGRKFITTTLPSEEGQAANTKTDLSDEEITELLKKRFGIMLSSPFTIKDTEIVPPPVNY